MTSFCTKRLAKERERFTTDDSEFWVNWKDDNLRKFEAYIVGPEDSVYKCKLIKLKFNIPDNYPIIPPKVTFVQHTGDRLHPNLYTEGKVCLSILGTWSGPEWAQNMNIEGVLRTLRSLLDQKPYMHEPGQSDRPEFNAYVRYHSWRWLLLDYLERETDSDAKAWLDKYMVKHGKDMLAELERQREDARCGQVMTSSYAVRQSHVVDHHRLLSDLEARIPRVMEPVYDPMPARQAMEEARTKRNLPFENESTAWVMMPAGQEMEEVKKKRRLPFESESTVPFGGPPPAKKQHVVVDLEPSTAQRISVPAPKHISRPAPEVIDLTED